MAIDIISTTPAASAASKLPFLDTDNAKRAAALKRKEKKRKYKLRKRNAKLLLLGLSPMSATSASGTMTPDSDWSLSPLNSPTPDIKFTWVNLLKQAVNEANAHTTGAHTFSLNSIASIARTDSEKLNSLAQIKCAISYPARFCPDAEHFRNPQKIQTELTIIDWLDQFNLLGGTSGVRDRMLRLESNSFGDYVLSTAGPEYACLMGKFFAIFVMVDDQILEPMALDSKYIDLCKPAMQLFEAATASAGRETYEQFSLRHAEVCSKPIDARGNALGQYVACWMDLVGSFVTLGASREWQARLSTAVRDYIAFGFRESKTVGQLQSSWMKKVQAGDHDLSTLGCFNDPTDPTPINAHELDLGAITGQPLLTFILEQRIHAIGVPMFAIMMERSAGCEVQSLVAPNVVEKIRQLVELSAIPCYLVNDMYGLARDIRNDEHCFNDMLLAGGINGWNLKNSIDFATRLHDLCVQAIDRITDSMEYHHPQLGSYLKSLRLLVRGYGQWHGHCLRYTQATAACLQNHEAYNFTLSDL